MIQLLCIIVMAFNYPILMIVSYFVGGFVTYINSRRSGIYIKMRLLQEFQMKDRVKFGWHTEVFMFFVTNWIILDFEQMVQSVNNDFEILARELGSDRDQEE